jgi:protein-S-isoprenylcysteine O-methyltransferase Ste14
MQPRKKSWKEKVLEYFPRYNKELADVSKRTHRNREIIKKLEKILLSEEDDKTALAFVEQNNPSYESGLAFGYLLPEIEYSPINSVFADGFKKGQVYALKKDFSRASRSLITKGLALVSVGQILYAKGSPYEFSAEHALMSETIQSGLTYGAVASGMYGIGTMLLTNLFMNDEKLSNKLLTSCPFAMHRNPFYTGVIISLACSTAKIMCANAYVENPNWLAAVISLFGLGLTTKGFIDYTKNDEIILEKQFGDEYREYKKRTPRFFPKISNLWRKKENKRS